MSVEQRSLEFHQIKCSERALRFSCTAAGQHQQELWRI